MRPAELWLVSVVGWQRVTANETREKLTRRFTKAQRYVWWSSLNVQAKSSTWEDVVSLNVVRKILLSHNLILAMLYAPAPFKNTIPIWYDSKHPTSIKDAIEQDLGHRFNNNEWKDNCTILYLMPTTINLQELEHKLNRFYFTPTVNCQESPTLWTVIQT